MNNEKLHIDELKSKLSHKTSINIEDFYEFYKEIYTNISKSTVRWYVYNLKEMKILKNIARGTYAFEHPKEPSEIQYSVITMDIIGSSQKSHKEFNLELEEKVEKLNKTLNTLLEYKRKFYISQGDEIQILCPFDDRIEKLLLITLSILSPLKCRFAISIGEIHEEDIKENSWDMNGPVFWNARDKISQTKKSKSYNGVVASEYAKVDKICNMLLQPILILINQISQKQWDAILEQFVNDDIKISSEILGISQSSFYDRIKSSNIYEISTGLKGLVELIGKRGKFI